ncbi:MAG: hypothetical protein WC979_05690 [Candidatus Pacearchaeota archaeon]
MRKPWRSKKEISYLESEICGISREVEDTLIDLAYHAAGYTRGYLFETRIDATIQLEEAWDFMGRLDSCYLINSSAHPDYEATFFRVNLISRLIIKELSNRGKRNHR